VIGGIVTAIGTIGPAIVAIAGFISGAILPILAIIAVVALLYAAWKTNFGGIRDTVTTIFAAIKLVFQAFKAALSGDWTAFGELLRQAWDTVWALMEQRIRNAWNAIKSAGKTIVDGIKALFHIDWSELGSRIITGLVNGLRNGIGKVIQMAKSVAQAASNAVKGFLGISSPSKLMASYGKSTAEGFAQGMRSNAGMFDVTNALKVEQNVSRAGFSDAATPRSSVPSSGGSAGGLTINIENPKKETAEESIRKTLKSLSFTGAIPT